MSLLAAVAQLEVGRPTTATGWVILAIVAILILTVLFRGTESVVGTAAAYLKKVFWVLVALGAVLLLPRGLRALESDPLVRTDTELFPDTPSVVEVDGTVQLSGTEDSNHSHEPAD